MLIIITDKNNDKHVIKSWSESHKCNASYADYEFVSYNFIKKLIWDSYKKHTLSVFVMHVYKIFNKNKSSDKSQISTTTSSFTISSSADVNVELLNYKDV